MSAPSKDQAVRSFGLIGKDLSHSFSKDYFDQKFLKLGLKNYEYRLFPLSSVEDFPAFLESNPGLSGLNVTIPYKETILQYIDELDPVARDIGAVNTLLIDRHHSGTKLKGFNTDVFGFEASLNRLLTPVNHALILGDGGAAKAIRYALKRNKIETRTVSRSPKKGQISYQDISTSIVRSVELIVNTTPLGTYPAIEACPPFPCSLLSAQHTVIDLIYNPSKTRFLAEAENQGAHIMNGRYMLEKQADASFDIWQA